ncbi:MAG: hypothetical protein QW814_00955 [Methanothrix sp.]
MDSSKDIKRDISSKRINEMVKKYGVLFYGSSRLLTGMKNVYDGVDERIIDELFDSVEFSRLLDNMKQSLSKDNNKTTFRPRTQRNYSNTVLDIVAAIYASNDIGDTYKIDGSNKNLFELDIGIANALINDPKQARKAVALMNKIAINSYAISEIIKRKNGVFPEADILAELPEKFYIKLMEKIGAGESGSYKDFISSCFKMVEGKNKGYNVALVSKSDIIHGLVNDKLALNRLLGLYYFVSGIKRD